MYRYLYELLSDKKGGVTFSCFDISHLCYIGITLAIATCAVWYFKTKNRETRLRAQDFFIDIAFGLYILDFFLMPFAYGEIDIEKLPFHICTAMCVAGFLSHRVEFLKKFRVSIATLGFISNLVYLIYPAGVMWHAVHPLSYRVVQTLIFHGVMTIYGLLVLVFECERVEVKNCLCVTVAMTLWAMLGNALYNGTAGDYSHNFNWFFVTRDPFYLLPTDIAPYLMPVLNTVLFFAASVGLHALMRIIKKSKSLI